MRLLAAASWSLVAPATARIALDAVVCSAFGATSWPQQTHLVLDEGQTTLKVARGDSFTLSVKVRPGDKVPESAQATYPFRRRRDSGRAAAFDRRGRVPGADRVGESAVSFHGDCRRRRSSIRDVPVKVVAAADLKSLAIRVIPPEYTGMPAQVLAPGIDAASRPRGNEARARGDWRTSRWPQAELKIGQMRRRAATLAFDQIAHRFHDGIDGQGQLQLLV